MVLSPVSGLGVGLVCAEVYRKGPVPLMALRPPRGGRRGGSEAWGRSPWTPGRHSGERRYFQQPQPVWAEGCGQLLLPGLMCSGTEEVVPSHRASGQQLWASDGLGYQASSVAVDAFGSDHRQPWSKTQGGRAGLWDPGWAFLLSTRCPCDST